MKRERLSPTSRNRAIAVRKFRVGSFLFVIVGVQLVVLWRYSLQASQSPSSVRNEQSLLPPKPQAQKVTMRHRDGNRNVQNQYTVVTNVSADKQQEGLPLPPVDSDAQDQVKTSQSSTMEATKLWHRSSTLPQWIRDYFDWADEQQRHLSQENWSSQKFLILKCLKSDAHCGGTSDRLKPIPVMMLAAMRSKRLFYIRWTRPCPLEEFLLPNAYNWTMPQWLVPHFENDRSHTRVNVDRLIKDVNSSSTFIHTRIQSFDGGSIYFNEQFNGTGVTYETIYHDLFRILFTPSPPIQVILNKELSSAGLEPGKYATAHYRAFYGHRKPSPAQIAEASINAVECASELRPGGPVYFAADTTIATQAIKAYAQNYSRAVVIIENDEPLHLDKANSTNPSDYYSVFVDLFLLGMGRCASVGMGGFGRYGLLLSYNATCWNRHLYNRNRLDCHWKDAPTGAVLASETANQ